MVEAPAAAPAWIDRTLGNARECRGEPAEIAGTIPPFVRGTYYGNGPARFRRPNVRYRHWLDGDGMVCALRLSGGGARLTARFVITEKLAAEDRVDRALFRTFGTSFPSDRLMRGVATASPANVSVYPFAGALLAFGEQGLPYSLDPETLETVGPYRFDGSLNDVSPFSAHPKLDPCDGSLVNFGVSFSAEQPCLRLYHFGAGGDLRSRARCPIEHPHVLHDFGLSPRYAVFHLGPYLLDVRALLDGGRTTLEALRWAAGLESRLLIVARADGRPVASVPVGQAYCLHHINAFEEAGRLVADLIEFDGPLYDQYDGLPDLFVNVPAGRPVRYVIDPRSGALVDRRALDYALAPDFPSLDPGNALRPYREFWVLGISRAGRPGRKFFDELARLDWSAGGLVDRYRAPAGSFLGGEPVFIPDPDDPGGGVVICQAYDGRREAGSFALFEAHDLARGPIARIDLREPIRFGFHSTFVPESTSES